MDVDVEDVDVDVEDVVVEDVDVEDLTSIVYISNSQTKNQFLVWEFAIYAMNVRLFLLAVCIPFHSIPFYSMQCNAMQI